MSVVLPVRNGGQLLGRAIESVLAQTHSAFELLVVDDGSTDQSHSLAAGYAAGDPRVKPLKSPGNGLVDALNFGVRSAGAALIARMDADDVAMPERLARQVAAMADRPDLCVIGSAAVLVDAHGRDVGLAQPPLDPDRVAAALSRVNPIVHPSTIIRREALLACGLYRPAYLRAEDYDLWLRLAERGRIANLPEPLLRYRVAEGFDAARFATQVTSEMAARAAARLRRAGRPDPTDGLRELAPAALRALGLTRGDLARGIARRSLQEARRLRRLGSLEAANAALALADRQPLDGLKARLEHAVRRLKALA